jgi:dienelactone hydrolase
MTAARQDDAPNVPTGDCTLDGYDTFVVSAAGSARTVYHRGAGPPIVLLHELPGLTPQCVALANRLVGRGFHIHMPLLFGEPCQDSPLQSFARLCVSREFHLFSRNETSPIANWLRVLCREVRRRTGAPGVGVIGLCLTGGLALVLIAEDTVPAAVASEPSLPLPVPFTGYKAALGMESSDLAASRARMARDGRRILALRFRADPLCTEERFTSIATELGQGVELVVLDSPDPAHGVGKCAHAVLTKEYRDEIDHPTRLAYETLIDFLRRNL